MRHHQVGGSVNSEKQHSVIVARESSRYEVRKILLRPVQSRVSTEVSGFVTNEFRPSLPPLGQNHQRGGSQSLEWVGQNHQRGWVTIAGIGCQHHWNTQYADGRHEQAICLERYEASKELPRIVEQLDQALLYNTEGERFFTLTVTTDVGGVARPYKVCFAVLRDNRLLRIHVTSAFVARVGEGAPGVPVTKKGHSIYKVISDVRKKPNGQRPKEVQNRHQKK